MTIRKRTEAVLARRYEGGTSTRRPEEVLVEEPMEILLDGERVATTMRTPGHDFELAVGWCWSEGALADGATVSGVRYCATGSAVETAFNVVSVDTDGSSNGLAARLGTVTSSCGVCGTDSVAGLVDWLKPLDPVDNLDAHRLAGLAAAIADRQELFGRTGGSHAAAACRPDGDVMVVREDIGRHNAVDKVVGRLYLDDDLPASGLVLWVSGRASFEMVQKAWAGGFAALVSVSAPSSLAITTARQAGLTLAGFARDGRFTVYTDGSATPVVPGDPARSAT